MTSLGIKQKARELGFDLCGIAPAADLPELTFFEQWLARGYAGEMGYLHRSNLVGMGVLPMQFLPGENAASLGLTGEETFDILGVEAMTPRKRLTVRATKPNGDVTEFGAIARIDSPVEVEYFRNGGILQTVLRRLTKPAA